MSGPTLYFDLSEFFNSSSKFRYYGIAKVVKEIAVELHHLGSGVRYVIYSPGHRKFFEVTPIFGARELDAPLELGVDLRASPLRVRQTHYASTFFSKAIERGFAAICRAIDRVRWRGAAVSLPEVDLNGAVLVAAGRPKIIIEYLAALRQAAPDAKFVPLLHDMIPLIGFNRAKARNFALHFQRDNIQIINQSWRVLCNSDFTRTEIERCASEGLIPRPRQVIAIPLAHECKSGSEPSEREAPDAPYLLCVGSTLGRKNLECVFNALALLASQGRPIPTLVLAGVARKRVTKFLSAENYALIRDRVVMIHDPNQTDLVKLYANALALALPSKTEGWGLPAGEALWLGIPALCSDIPVLREVCGDMGLYFNPDRPEQLAEIVDRLFSDPAWRATVRQNIAAGRGSLRSWRDVARDVIAAVR